MLLQHICIEVQCSEPSAMPWLTYHMLRVTMRCRVCHVFTSNLAAMSCQPHLSFMPAASWLKCHMVKVGLQYRICYGTKWKFVHQLYATVVPAMSWLNCYVPAMSWLNCYVAAMSWLHASHVLASHENASHALAMFWHEDSHLHSHLHLGCVSNYRHIGCVLHAFINAFVITFVIAFVVVFVM